MMEFSHACCVYVNLKLTNGEFEKRSLGHLGRNWDRAISTANEYSCILNVSVGPCGVLATLK